MLFTGGFFFKLADIFLYWAGVGRMEKEDAESKYVSAARMSKYTFYITLPTTWVDLQCLEEV